MSEHLPDIKSKLINKGENKFAAVRLQTKKKHVDNFAWKKKSAGSDGVSYKI